MSSVQIDFWNVGQGDGSTITLPDGSLIVIDVGPLGSSLSKWLSDRRNSYRIKRLILTHNDSDHIGGLEAIVNASNVTIDKANFLVDCHEKTTHCRLLESIKKKQPEIKRLECESGQPYSFERWDNYELSLRYPSMEDNVPSSTSNQTSGILVLSYLGRDCISWGADNDLSTISKYVAKDVDMQFGPHHGAPQDFPGEESKSALAQLSPKRCFLSVASKNRYKHPLKDFIKSLRKIDCIPMCSQLTKRCSHELFLKGQEIHNSAGLYLLPLPNPPNIQCWGHVRFFLNDGNFEFHKYSQATEEKIAKLGDITACSKHCK